MGRRRRRVSLIPSTFPWPAIGVGGKLEDNRNGRAPFATDPFVIHHAAAAAPAPAEGRVQPEFASFLPRFLLRE